jgi:hypothetical protein
MTHFGSLGDLTDKCVIDVCDGSGNERGPSFVGRPIIISGHYVIIIS